VQKRRKKNKKDRIIKLNFFEREKPRMKERERERERERKKR